MAKKIPVKCKVCNVVFDRNAEAAVKITANRYAHASCAEGYVPPQDEQDLAALHQYLKELFKDDYNYVALNKQIESFTSTGQYTITGILKSLVYWYEVLDNTIEKANNRIGIVPFIYPDARKYYLGLYLANEANRDKDLRRVKDPIVHEVKIKKPARPSPAYKLFDLDD